MNLARLGNKYLTETEPWKHWKNGDEARTRTILYYGIQIVANLGTLAEPFIPFTAHKLRDMLNVQAARWEQTGNLEMVPEAHLINKGELLFEKITDEQIEKQEQKLRAQSASGEEAQKTEETKPDIDFENFGKLDIRVVQIKKAESIPKADKLLKLTVDTGHEERTVVAGIAKQYKPEAVEGQQVCMLLNMAPKKMKGVDSQGMILMAEDQAGNLSFLRPDEAIAKGAKVR